MKKAGFKSIGKNVKIHNRASIYGPENISIGNNVRIDDFCVIIATGEMEIGNYVHLANFCYFGARNGIFIKDYCVFAPRVSVFTASDDYSGNYFPTFPSNFEIQREGLSGRVNFFKHTLIGAGSVVLPNLDLAEGTSIGAMSLVKESTKPWGIYCGIPAKKIKDRSKNILIQEEMLSAKFKEPIV